MKITEIELNFDGSVDYKVINAKINDTDRVIRAYVKDFDLSECEEIRVTINKPNQKISENIVSLDNIHGNYVDILLRLEDLCVIGEHRCDVTFKTSTEKITSSCFILQVYGMSEPLVSNLNYLYEFNKCREKLNEIMVSIENEIKEENEELSELYLNMSELLNGLTYFKNYFDNKTFNEIKETIFNKGEYKENLFIQENEPEEKNGIWIKSNKTNIKIVKGKYISELRDNKAIGTLSSDIPNLSLLGSSFHPIPNMGRMKYRVYDGYFHSFDYSDGYPIITKGYLVTFGRSNYGDVSYPSVTTYKVDYETYDLKGEKIIEMIYPNSKSTSTLQYFQYGNYIYVEDSNIKNGTISRFYLNDHGVPQFGSETIYTSIHCDYRYFFEKTFDKYFIKEKEGGLFLNCNSIIYMCYLNYDENYGNTLLTKKLSINEHVRDNDTFVIKGDFIYYLPNNYYYDENNNRERIDITITDPVAGKNMCNSDGVKSEDIFRIIIKSNMSTGERTYLRFPKGYYIFGFDITDNCLKLLYGVRQKDEPKMFDIKYLETEEEPYSFTDCEDEEIRILINETNSNEYQIQLVNPSIKVSSIDECSNLLKTSLGEVPYATKDTNGSFISDEVYYGDGTSWIKF